MLLCHNPGSRYPKNKKSFPFLRRFSLCRRGDFLRHAHGSGPTSRKGSLLGNLTDEFMSRGEGFVMKQEFRTAKIQAGKGVKFNYDLVTVPTGIMTLPYTSFNKVAKPA